MGDPAPTFWSDVALEDVGFLKLAREVGTEGMALGVLGSLEWGALELWCN